MYISPYIYFPLNSFYVKLYVKFFFNHKVNRLGLYSTVSCLLIAQSSCQHTLSLWENHQEQCEVQYRCRRTLWHAAGPQDPNTDHPMTVLSILEDFFNNFFNFGTAALLWQLCFMNILAMKNNNSIKMKRKWIGRTQKKEENVLFLHKTNS